MVTRLSIVIPSWDCNQPHHSIIRERYLVINSIVETANLLKLSCEDYFVEYQDSKLVVCFKDVKVAIQFKLYINQVVTLEDCETQIPL